MRDALAARQIRLPLALSAWPDELGVVRDADGVAVFTVDTEGTWPDQQVFGVAFALIAALNATAPRSAAAAAEIARSALEVIAAILAPIAETSDAAMAAFQVAEDACTELAHAEPSADA